MTSDPGHDAQMDRVYLRTAIHNPPFPKDFWAMDEVWTEGNLIGIITLDFEIAEIADQLDDLLIEERNGRATIRTVVETCTTLNGDLSRITYAHKLTPRQQKVLGDLRREILDLALDQLRRPL